MGCCGKIKKLFAKPFLYYRTIRHLRAEQLFFQLYYRLNKRPRFCSLETLEPRENFVAKTIFPEPVEKYWLGGNTFKFLNVQREITSPDDWRDASFGKLWLYNLHYFDYLRQCDMTEEMGNFLIDKWIKENPVGRGDGWEPYPLSLRIVNWIKWSLSGHHLSDDAVKSLTIQTRFLSKRIERHLLANHYLANAKALVFAGMFFGGRVGETFLNSGLRIYKRELPEQILADGGHFERSVMYHSIILEDLLDLENISAPLDLTKHVDKMLDFLSAMTGPDGKISLFNDAAWNIALQPEKIFQYATSLGHVRNNSWDQTILLASSGYVRLVAGNWTAICDVAEIGPDYQPGHAHADTLTCEVWFKNKRLLTDSGTGEYIYTQLRAYQRGTAAHNTLRLNEKNSSEVWSAHRVANRAHITACRLNGDELTATHNGYCPHNHKRDWRLSENSVSVTDTLSGRGQGDVEIFWHFAPNTQIKLISATCAEIALGEYKFRFTISGNDSFGELMMEKGRFSPEFGVNMEIPVLTYRQRGAILSQFSVNTRLCLIE